MQDFKAQQLKSVIKDLLKKRGLTYEMLAEQLDCSVPTVKRILGQEEMTLTRLLQLCEILEIDLADLQNLAKDQNVKDERFTEEQEAFLSKNKTYFAYLMKLFSGESPKQIAEAWGLNQRSTDKYLIGLERHGLIRVTGKQKVKPAFKQVPYLGKGPVGKMYFESLIKNSALFMTEIIREAFVTKVGDSAESKKSSKFGTMAFKLSEASYQAWVEETEKSRAHIMKISEFEEKTKAPEELMTVVEVEGRARVANDHPLLKILDESFGPITNL
ncbi:MAG: helix-turn-helix transcriptional regulator [Bdellovibrionaceae bacterium]|nr:helix-turn-helix transcriptional regulator [Pseudobdellovibrionaceae bacterium]